MGLNDFAKRIFKRNHNKHDNHKVIQKLLDSKPDYLKGNSNKYEKFIVLAHHRSGSSMLISTLRKHPEAVVFGELFVPEKVGLNVPDYIPSAELEKIRNEDPIKFLDQFIFSSYNENRKIVGFKLFPIQIYFNQLNEIWHWIEDHPEVKIIFLDRVNKLATLASLEIATKTGIFGIKDAKSRPQEQIYLDPEYCQMQFELFKKLEEKALKCIARHNILEITYEELSANPNHWIGTCQEFLGLTFTELEITSIKKEIRPLSQVINNYNTLKTHFESTQWSKYFDE